MSRESAERAASSSQVPVTILTGFLGAGKTGLLNHILSGSHGMRIAVLVNDFGAVNIDETLIENREGDVVSLMNGCICCSLSAGLLFGAAGRFHHGLGRRNRLGDGRGGCYLETRFGKQGTSAHP